MAKQKWINDKLCSLAGDKVRVERGPQIIELDCNEQNLKNEVTSPHYQVGRKDAYGKVIGTDKKMHCVDWRNKLSPSLWKVYEMQETGELDKKTGEPLLGEDGEPRQRFIKVNEFEDKAEALTFAGGLV